MLGKIIAEIERKIRIEQLENEMYNLFECYRERAISYKIYETELKKIEKELQSLDYYNAFNFYEED